MNLKPGDVAALLSIKEPTLRKWSGDFGQYLSPLARGGDGRKRVYNEQDAQILLLIRDMKAGNATEDDIHASMKSLQASEWRGLPELPAAPPGMDPIAVIPTQAAEATLVERERAWNAERQVLLTRIEILEDQLETTETDRDKIQAELSELRERVGRLSGQLDERQSTRFWLVILAGVVIVAIVVVVILLRLG